MSYRRFRLLFTSDRDGGYTIQALTPEGEGQSHFTPPHPEAVSAAAPPPRRKQRALRDVVLNGETSSPSRGYLGEQLFEALFQGRLLGLYERNLAAAATANTGFRIELTFDPSDPDLAAVQALPWELLRAPGTPEFLALHPRTPITRFLFVPRPITAAIRPETLRILAVRPHPPRLRSLQLGREFHSLQEAVGSAAEVVPVAPTLAGLRQALRDHECHALHFMGHGGSLAGQTENVLFFEDKDGNPDPVTGTDLANVLAASPSLRLAVLNACESASIRQTGAGGARFNPFTGVANALVVGGLPAVVAMQDRISDTAAILFSRTFYRQLAASASVDTAVTEGRRAVHAENRQHLEWATPVLFLRTPTGELYPQEDLWDRPPGKTRARWLAAALLALLLAGGAGFALRHWRVERLVAEGAAFVGDEQWAAARERFLDAHYLNPDSAEVLSNLAGVEEQLGHLGDAEEHYREAVRRQPTSAAHLYNLGHFLNRRRSYDEAYRILLQAVEKDPQRANAQAELAVAAAALGMPGRARIHLQAALRLAPEHPALHRRFGELEIDSGNPQAAIPYLDEALRRYPLGDLGRVETVWLLARAYDRLGNAPATCRELRELHRLDPSGITPWAQEAVETAARRRCPQEP